MTGTVTFLFTDIEGSTQLWERHPQAMQAALAKHDALLDQAIANHGGQTVKRTGDGCHAVFAAALDSALAALAAQQAIAAEPWTGIEPDRLRVRMALHTGEAEAREGDYYGPALNRAARVMAAGHGGQVLLSQVTAELVRDQLPAAVSLRDLGEHRLKDLTRPEHIFQLGTSGLPADFPALRSLDASPHNLPVQLTHFIGREREMVEVRRLLSETSLLTLTGSGGTGKTRLSLQVAADLLHKFPHGAWLAELAAVTDPELVVPTLAAMLGARQQPGRPLFDTLVDFLRAKQLLLILDNCEHLISACAEVAERLLRQCPRLKIIASSREALGIAGETTYPVPSLSLPAATASAGTASAADLAQSEAVRLFVDRAKAALPSFAFTDDNAPAVAIICRRLDGIPLAIELAAARVRMLRVEQIAARLDDRFRLLTGGSRTALPRQQTLRALIDWSYALLSEPERAFLQQLSVFAGGWTLEAAESVCNGDAFDLLTQLANKSLIVVDHDTSEPARYRLLETIRQYAREKLLETGDPAHWRERHLRYFLDYAVQAQPALNGPLMSAWQDRFELEHDNFRAALGWALDRRHGDPLAAMQLVEALSLFLARRGHTTEGLAWLGEVLARGEAAAPAEGPLAGAYQLARARTLSARALFDFGLISNAAAARAAAEESVRLARQLGDRQLLANSLAVLGMTAGFWGDLDRARAAGGEALALGRELGDTQSLILALGTFSIVDQASQTSPESMRKRLAEMLRLARQTGNPWTIALTTLNLARLEAASSSLPEARSLFEESMRLFSQVGDPIQLLGARSELAHATRHDGQLDEAMTLYGETLRGWQHLGQRGAIAHQLESLAIVALARQQGARAARLLGAAETLRETSGAVHMAIEHAEYERTVADLRAQLPALDLEAAWTEGRAMAMDEAVEYALNETP
jgi:predicted ATPase/class 3 adenylate cyclase